MRTTCLLPIVAVYAAFAAGCKPTPEATPPTNTGPPMPAAAKGNVAAGKTVFASKCAGCHGPSGEGRLAGTPRFSDPGWQKQQNDAGLLGVIRIGKGRMPAWRGRLTEKQIMDVEAFVRTLGQAKTK